MDVYACDRCGYYYDPECGDEEGHVKEGTPFSRVPGSWICPECGAPKQRFYKLDTDEFEDDYDDREQESDHYSYADYDDENA